MYRIGASILSRLKTTGGLDSKSAIKLELSSHCWLCEGWTQHVFKYHTDNRTEVHDPYAPIKLHMEFEDFEGDLMLPSLGNPDIYELARMLPPGSHRYFFTYRGELVVAKG